MTSHPLKALISGEVSQRQHDSSEWHRYWYNLAKSLICGDQGGHKLYEIHPLARARASVW